MEKLHFSITIKAPKEKVWETMLDENTYKQWTDVFGHGSHYKGTWEEGSKILFLAPSQNGKMQGMVSRIKENKKYEFISIEHLGMITDGIENTTSEEIKAWAGATENYTFKEKNGETQVLVDTDTVEEYKKMFEDTWPRALQKLKSLSEK